MEEKNLDLLLVPSAKKNSKFPREYPFPIVTNKCKENESDPAWKIAEGFIQENYVLVHDEDSMKRFYSMGFFGKGTLSKNAPKVCLQKTSESEKKKEISAASTPVDDIINVVDSDDESSDSKEKESLQLSFQEAFFLSYGLGSLVVKDKGRMLNLSSLWTKFCELTPSGDFPVMYTAYHHFRSKGWIVKSGLKFGTDYVLYKDGPPFYHATYSVIVRALKENLRDVKDNRDLTWSSVAAINRVNTTAGKGLLFLYVIQPNNMTERTQSTPLCISQFKLEEVLYKRWVAAENRKETLNHHIGNSV